MTTHPEYIKRREQPLIDLGFTKSIDGEWWSDDWEYNVTNEINLYFKAIDDLVNEVIGTDDAPRFANQPNYGNPTGGWSQPRDELRNEQRQVVQGSQDKTV